MKTRLATALMAMLLSIPLAAQASLFNFSFTDFVGNVLSGQLSGTLLSDNDTVQVSSILSAALNGNPGPALPNTGTFTAYFNNYGFNGPFDGQGLVSFSASTMDFVACDAGCADGFAFTPSALFGGNHDTESGFFGGGDFVTYTLFNASDWSLTAVSPVPEPSEIALLGIGFVGLGISRRKKHRGR